MTGAARTLILARPRGFCAGVRRALEMAEPALRTSDPPLYGYNELVHNRHVVADLSARGLRFIRDLEDVPTGARVLFSAHGVAPAVRDQARRRGLSVLDATCPFVQKVHAEVRRFAHSGHTIFLIGKRGHDEVVGVAGEAPGRVMVLETAADARTVQPADAARVAAVTQTTLSQVEAGALLDILRSRFPALRTPSSGDICHATTLRQDAVRVLARHVGHILVLGSRNSSNTLRLLETARQSGVTATLVDTVEPLTVPPTVRRLGLTAGASTPDAMIEQVVARLEAMGYRRGDDVGTAEGDGGGIQA